MEVESRTGRGLDSWIEALNRSNANDWNYAEIMAFLRRYGMEFSWQKRITQAYEQSLGRSPVATSPIGGLQIVEQSVDEQSGIENTRGSSATTKWYQNTSLDQIGIWQWMLIAFCAACLFRFTSAFSRHLPTGLELATGIPLFVGLGFLTVVLVTCCLAIGKIRRRRLIMTFGGIGLLLGLLYGVEQGFGIKLVSSPTGWTIAGLTFLFLLAFNAIMIAVLILARHREYRVVKVNRIPTPVAPPAPNTILVSESCVDGANIPVLIGTAIEGIGIATLFQGIRRASAPSLQSAAQELDRIMAYSGSPEDEYLRMIRNERRFMATKMGWKDRIIERLVDGQSADDQLQLALIRRSAFRQLLRIELAIELFHRKHGKYPQNLKALVPEFSPDIPLDVAWQGNEPRPLQYLRSDDEKTFRLYSVGVNRVDDGGKCDPDDLMILDMDLSISIGDLLEENARDYERHQERLKREEQPFDENTMFDEQLIIPGIIIRKLLAIAIQKRYIRRK